MNQNIPLFEVEFILHIRTDIGWGTRDPELRIIRSVPAIPHKGDSLAILDWTAEIEEVAFVLEDQSDDCTVRCYLVSDQSVNDESWARPLRNANHPQLQAFINKTVDTYLALGFSIRHTGIYQTPEERA